MAPLGADESETSEPAVVGSGKDLWALPRQGRLVKVRAAPCPWLPKLEFTAFPVPWRWDGRHTAEWQSPEGFISVFLKINKSLNLIIGNFHMKIRILCSSWKTGEVEIPAFGCCPEATPHPPLQSLEASFFFVSPACPSSIPSLSASDFWKLVPWSVPKTRDAELSRWNRTQAGAVTWGPHPVPSLQEGVGWTRPMVISAGVEAWLPVYGTLIYR